MMTTVDPCGCPGLSGPQPAPKPATLHKGRSWWIIPDGARGFNEMRDGFKTRDAALGWAAARGYLVTRETEA